MNKTLTLTAALLCAAIPLSAGAQANDDPNRPPRSGSLTQDAKNDGRTAKREIKEDAHEAKQNIKSAAAKTKRKLAVAKCSDGRYSYTHHNTCNHHGGVMKRYR